MARREIVLPRRYYPVRGGTQRRPQDQRCPDCDASPGWLCWDLRARPRTKQTMRPHPARCVIVIEE